MGPYFRVPNSHRPARKNVLTNLLHTINYALALSGKTSDSLSRIIMCKFYVCRGNITKPLYSWLSLCAFLRLPLLFFLDKKSWPHPSSDLAFGGLERSPFRIWKLQVFPFSGYFQIRVTHFSAKILSASSRVFSTLSILDLRGEIISSKPK